MTGKSGGTSCPSMNTLLAVLILVGHIGRIVFKKAIIDNAIDIAAVDE